MKSLSRVLLVAASFALLSVGAASSQTGPSLNGQYKGTMVCALPLGEGAVLRAPLDMIVADNTVSFARPILNGNNVVGNEIVMGTIEEGMLTLRSSGTQGAAHYEGKYAGVITADGGTFTGTQSWTMADVTRTRPCTGAFVKSRS